MNLDDMLHRCPAVLKHLEQTLDTRSKSALLATSSGVRQQVSALLERQYMVSLLPVCMWWHSLVSSLPNAGALCRVSNASQAQV